MNFLFERGGKRKQEEARGSKRRQEEDRGSKRKQEEAYYLLNSLDMRSGRLMRRSSRMMFWRSEGLYQKKNWRWASLSRCVLAEYIGSSVYGW